MEQKGVKWHQVDSGFRFNYALGRMNGELEGYTGDFGNPDNLKYYSRLNRKSFFVHVGDCHDEEAKLFFKTLGSKHE